jgi:hypothetical protein
MKTIMIKTSIFITLIFLLPLNLSAKAKQGTSADAALNQEVYQLSYIEREPGTDEYEISMLVSERFIRIDEMGEDSGYILYDNKDKIIYSVSHFDKSVLVINEQVFSEGASPAKAYVEYLALADAPAVSGKPIFNYRVYIKGEKNTVTSEEDEQTCTEIQLVEGLLPDVRKILQNYQKVVSGQQVRMTDNKITEMQTDCYYVDQIYNLGSYYEKGLPIQEWHSNERFRSLIGYSKITVDRSKFKVPETYRQFSMDKKSKIPLQ